jgi:hypothetical protein
VNGIKITDIFLQRDAQNPTSPNEIAPFPIGFLKVV